jgi:hypothetical protein
MDIGTLASALIAGTAARLQLAAAARIMRMDADARDSAAQLIDAAQRNGARLSAAVAGMGGNLDIVA